MVQRFTCHAFLHQALKALNGGLENEEELGR
jgi:hypothetical protein